MADAPATSLPKAGADDVLYIVDISSYIFRAYHALPPLSNSRGEPTHAIAGVAQMLMRLFNAQDPKHVVVALDAPGPSFRKEIFDEYKATRPPAPEDLKAQIHRVREMVEAWGLSQAEKPGYEADDLIAALVKLARSEGKKAVIVSADKDLLQLVGPDVVMYDSMREKVYGPAETVAKMGVPPEQVRDLLALMGDSSDNIPGVPKVGQKTAAKLLEQLGDLDGIYAALDDVKGKAIKARLEDNRDAAYLSQRLVALAEDVDPGLTFEKTVFTGGHPAELRKLFAELEFTRLLAQLDPQPTLEGHYDLITTVEDLRRFATAAAEGSEMAIVTILDEPDHHSGRLVGIGLSLAEGRGVYLPLGHRYVGAPDVPSEADALPILKPLFENSLLEKRCSDAKREKVVLDRYGIALRGVRFDVMLASYLLDPGRHAHDLVSVARAEIDAEIPTRESIAGKGKAHRVLDMVEVERVRDYAAQHADFVLRLSHLLEPRMAEGDLRSLMYELELPLASVLAELEETGIRLDTALLARLSEEAHEEIERLEGRCHELAGHEFNVASPRQLETILFDELELPVQKRTKTARSTDMEVLEDLSVLHELPRVILEYRSLAKLKSTYLDALPKEVDPKTGRIHSRFNQAVAATGRISSSDPNLQNIPIRTEEGRKIRAAFIPGEGWELMAADYSQIELRVLAHLSQDPELVDAYTTDEDVHARTASAIFGVPPSEVDREMRARAKTVNFAVIYGQSHHSLSKNLRIERREAMRYIEAFFERYAGVKRFMDELIEGAKEKGYVTTLMGRRRPLPDIRSKNHQLRSAAERIARNTPIQGSAADIIKRAMIDIQHEIHREDYRARMLLTVHDELVFEAPPEEKDALQSMVRAKMEGAIELLVPLVVDVGWGPNWGEAH